MAWKYDADEHDPLTTLRIPVVSSWCPRWRYEVALCIDPTWADPPLRPTDAEAAMIAAYIDYRREWYNDGWRAKMLREPLDTDSGANTVVLLKVGDDAWCYRRESWQSGPPWVPATYGDGKSTLSLAALLDRINEVGDGRVFYRWAEFKAARPDVWTPAPADG